MPVRIWLHEGHDGEPGVEAWACELELTGFGSWAPSRGEIEAQLPGKLARHRRWLERHGLDARGIDAGFSIVDCVHGNEILLETDREAANPGEIEQAIELLRRSRANLLAELSEASDELLDWDPPYASFAAWADWRSIRDNLAHVANGETHYYTRCIGHEPSAAPIDATGDWRGALARSREQAIGFLRELVRASDRARVVHVDLGFGAEDWSVRKALRRMVRHELTHWHSIQRIVRDYAQKPR